MLEFSKRSRRADTLVEERRIWLSRCGGYRVVEAIKRFRRGNRGRLREFRAELRDGRGWLVASRHRTRFAAVAACQRRFRSDNRLSPRRGKNAGGDRTEIFFAGDKLLS